MKIAVYEPEPRLCGPMMWAHEIVKGLNRAGHEAHTVTSTKSGRPSKQWGGDLTQSRGVRNWPHMIDVVVKNVDLVDTLDSYDLIIMPDVMNAAQDRAATKSQGTSWQHRPWYIEVLEQTKTRWISGLHGNFYTPKKAPYLGELLAAGNRSRVMYTNSPNSLTSDNDLIRETTWEPIHLPYELKLPDDTPLPPKNTIGATGRFIFNKGQPSLALAASMINPEITTEIWGACSSGLGPSPTFVTFEAMMQLDPASQRKRYGNDPDDVTGMGGNIVASFLWDWKYSTGQVVRYLGVYAEPTAVTQRLGLHLGLTVANFSGGLVEFASLEAMDAGSMSMVLPNVAHPDYVQSVLDPVHSWPGMKKQLADMESLRPLADRINAYYDNATDAIRLDAKRHNREAIRRNNDPAVVGQRIIELAFS